MHQIPIIVMGDPSGRFIEAIESQRGPVSVVRHVHDLSEMLAVAHSGLARLVLIVTGHENLTQSTISTLQELDISVCQVVDSPATHVLPGIIPLDALADPTNLIQQLEQVAQGHYSSQINQQEQGLQGQETTSAHPEAKEHIPPIAEDSEDEQQEPSQHTKTEQTKNTHQPPLAPIGKVLTIWGPNGAPGRTTLAVNLAGAFADTGQKVCLIDADTYGASVSAVLGLTDDYSSLAQLCHYAERDKLTTENCAELTHTIAHHEKYLDVITGINRADRWAEIRTTALKAVIEKLTSTYDLLIIDTSFNLEEDTTITFDGLAPQRNDATLTALRAADHCLLIGLADVVGVPRLIKGFEAYQEATQDTTTATITIALNRVRAESVGPSPHTALQHSWDRFGPAQPISAFLPEDSPNCDRARLQGKTLLEVAPESALTQEINHLHQKLRQELGLKAGEPSRRQALASSSTSMVEKKKNKFKFTRKGRASGES